MDMIIHKQNNNYCGEISISGAKNSAVALLPGCLLTDKLSVIHNIPNITDINIIIDIMKEMGHFVMYSHNTVIIKRNNEAPITFSDKVSKLRGSYYFIGACLPYFKKIRMKSCGGCDLGSRPINYHIDCFKQFNAKFEVDGDYLCFEGYDLKNANVTLPFPSVGATINCLLLSSSLEGESIINNAAIEPEVIDCMNFLNSMGANIKLIDNKYIVNGNKVLKGTEYSIISDRIEAGTYLTLGCLPNVSNITIKNIDSSLLTSYINSLKDIGYNVITNSNTISIKKNNFLKNAIIKTGPYPSFPSDLAPVICTILAFSNGVSIVQENIFSNRFSHINELNKLGASMYKKQNETIINPINSYHGGIVTSHDLRCSAALVLGCIASGEECIIRNIDSFFRGYENPLEKLKKVGISCTIID